VEVRGSLDRLVRGITHDSRDVQRDWLFVALPGRQHDGHDYVADLPQACAVLVQRPVRAAPGVTVLRVNDTRRALPFFAAAVHDNPGRRVPVVGITGTNGKTTISYLAAAALSGAGWPSGVVGTTGHLCAGEEIDLASVLGRAPSYQHTTPEAPQVQALLAHMAARGCRAVLMEASSIGIAFHRADAIPFQLAVYSNLTRDHLDIHGSMEAYRAAKARLFQELVAEDGLSILNRDDPGWRAMRPARGRTWTYGLAGGDISVISCSLTPQGSEARLRTPAGEGQLWVPLPGRHNLSNALAALGIALGLGAPLSQALEGIAAAPPVPGRLQPVPNDRGLDVFVDYAHTEDALSHVLAALRELARGRVICVFGCGGARDQGKRPAMGRVAQRGADMAVVTSDNPRSEDPRAIIDDILAGMPAAQDAARSHVQPDRALAIGWALQQARPGDVVVIAGKGHERSQDLGSRVIPFDDLEVARSLLENRSFLEQAP